MDPKSFRGFRETGPWDHFRTRTVVNTDESALSQTIACIYEYLIKCPLKLNDVSARFKSSFSFEMNPFQRCFLFEREMERYIM